jgi:predicted alpha-1,2-mannosidase
MNLKKLSLALIALAGCTTLLIAQANSASKDYVKLVNPMVGTDAHGHTFPGAVVPFGMIQLSPDTRTDTWDGCSGYHYSDNKIIGFSHTHFSGTGVGSGADIMLMPITGDVISGRGNLQSGKKDYRTAFSHEDESASPGFYSVKMGNEILAELTCTERTGFHKYTYPAGERANIILDLAHGITTRVDSLFLEVINNTTVAGFRKAYSSLDGYKTVWFVIEFSVPFRNYDIESQGKSIGQIPISSGKDLRAAFNFENDRENKVLVKVALSRVDKTGAMGNLKSELPGWDFEVVKENARQKWQEELGKIEVEGGTLIQQRTFYTAFYHCLIHPNIAMDADRRYFGTDHKIHMAAEFDNYTNFSLWDTFRALHPLFTIIHQQRTNQFIRCMIERYQNFGSLMIMEFGGNEGFGMTGYHSLSVIADAYVKGIRDYNVKLAFEGMKNLSEGLRAGKESYLKMGFIPCDQEDQSVSRTLEYAYDDWCVTRLAKDLDLQTFHKYSQKANFYQNVYCAEEGFMRGKQRNYMWQNSFNPQSTSNFTEGNAYQFSLFVPQDYQGLFKRMGGYKVAEQWLDKCFTTEIDPVQTRTGDMTGDIGQYFHGNEPSHHMAYLYNYLGKPWKSQERVRQIMDRLYSDKPDGLSGNEDAGQMSAWYILSALGFYSATPGMDYYVIGSPIFPKATIHLENGKKFIIRAMGASNKNLYVNSTSLNGKKTTKSYLKHDDIMKGGEMFVEMSDRPNKKWGAESIDIPYSESYPTPLMPQIKTSELYFKDSTEIKISCDEPGAEIRYTLDGSDPIVSDKLYSGPFMLHHSCKLKASSFLKGSHPSYPVSDDFIKLSLQKASEIPAPTPGLQSHYFDGYCVKLADMKKYPVTSKIVHPSFNISRIKDSRPFGYYFRGYINIAETGVYTFFLNSNDGSNLMVDGKTELINDGFHRAQERVCRILLEKGYHSIGVDYFQMGGAKALSLSWAFENGKKEEIPPEVLFHTGNEKF